MCYTIYTIFIFCTVIGILRHLFLPPDSVKPNMKIRQPKSLMKMKHEPFAKNSIYSVLYSLLNGFFPFIIYMYVARILTPENLGLVAAAQNNTRYFTLILIYGVCAYGIKVTAPHKSDKDGASRTFFEIASINTTLSLLFTLIYVCMVLLIPHFRGQLVLYLITGLDILLNIFNADWFFQGLEEYRYIAVRGLIVKLITLALILLFVKDTGDLYIYAAISVFSISGNYLLSLHRIRKKVSFQRVRPDCKKHIRHIMILCAAGIAAEIYSLADITMLDLLCEPSAVGYYNMTARSISAIRGVTLAVSAVFLPKMSRIYESGDQEAFRKFVNKGMQVVLSVSLPVSVGFFLVADDATRLFFGEAFLPSVTASKILAFSIIASALSNYVGLQVLVTLNQKKITTISNICGAIANVLLNLFLIRLFAQNGAAAASLVTGFLVAMVQIILSEKHIRISFAVIPALLSSAIMVAGVYLVRMYIPIWQLRLFLSVLTGAVLYLGALYLIRCSFRSHM